MTALLLRCIVAVLRLAASVRGEKWRAVSPGHHPP